jgi:hypothetical protein
MADAEGEAMSASADGNLAKLRALCEVGEPITVADLARRMRADYESVRASVRRMELVGLVVSTTPDRRPGRPAAFVPTDAGWAAVALGEPISLPRQDTIAHREAAEQKTQADWQPLHQALRMGRAPGKVAGRLVHFAIDREPSDWRWQA